MCNLYRSGNFLVDELELEALLLQNKIADVIQDNLQKKLIALLTN